MAVLLVGLGSTAPGSPCLRSPWSGAAARCDATGSLGWLCRAKEMPGRAAGIPWPGGVQPQQPGCLLILITRVVAVGTPWYLPAHGCAGGKGASPQGPPRAPQGQQATGGLGIVAGPGWKVQGVLKHEERRLQPCSWKGSPGIRLQPGCVSSASPVPQFPHPGSAGLFPAGGAGCEHRAGVPVLVSLCWPRCPARGRGGRLGHEVPRGAPEAAPGQGCDLHHLERI